MQLQYFEEYVKENLGIPNVNFSSLEIDVVKDIVEALEIVINKYPALKNSICSIGNNNDINNQYNLVINSHKRKNIRWDDFVVDEGETMSAIGIGTHIPLFKDGYLFEIQSFIALAYGDILIGKSLEEFDLSAKHDSEIGFHPKHCSNFKSKIYHEIGHILDFILNLSNDKKLYDIIREKSDQFYKIHEKISIYALSPRLDEIIAEAFSEYMICPDSNDLINGIGKYIDEKYKNFEESKIFKINKRFSNHLIRAEKELNENNRKK